MVFLCLFCQKLNLVHSDCVIMTVTYTSSVSTSSVVSNFLGLLLRWRGSIYKLVWHDLLAFMSLYFLFAVAYRFLMNENGQKLFENISEYCTRNVGLIPLSFVLGFYVSIVMTRWWEQYSTIPWPDPIAILVSSSLHGYDDRARAMRRTILRYVCLCQVLVFSMISPRVKRRFPTYDQFIEAGFLLENERTIIENMDAAFPKYPKHWMPIVWASSIVMRARSENKIRDDYAVKTIIDELNKFRGYCGFLLYYDWVSVPVVYTQVVTLAVYSFFLFTILGQQWTQNDRSRVGESVVKWFPFLTILQFFFYMGWLKVAEVLINPFGEDDDDFELNWIIDRNLTISYFVVDEMHQEHPELVKDQYWDEVFPNELPYNEPKMRSSPPEASTAHIETESKSLKAKSKGSAATMSVASEHSNLSSNRSRHKRFTSNFVPGPSTSGSFTDSYFLNIGHSRVVFSEDVIVSGQETQSLNRDSESTLDFNELMEQRRRERRERLRHRFMDMRQGTTRRASSGAPYRITVLRPPSAETMAQEQVDSEGTIKGPSKKPSATEKKPDGEK
ncbi:bestrophin-4 isoform X2 [Drosophila bipectinata]|uniref:bestrophin-4 isoform X2 n=1 Tax=Drosophila bipectinata TaxID=42026 RepID=UPI0038B29362